MNLVLLAFRIAEICAFIQTQQIENWEYKYFVRHAFYCLMLQLDKLCILFLTILKGLKIGYTQKIPISKVKYLYTDIATLRIIIKFIKHNFRTSCNSSFQLRVNIFLFQYEYIRMRMWMRMSV